MRSSQPKYLDSILPTTGKIIKGHNEKPHEESTHVTELRKLVQEGYANAYNGLTRNADGTYSREKAQ